MKKYYGTLIENKKPINGIWFTEENHLVFNKRSMGVVIWFGMMADTISMGQKYLAIPYAEITSAEYFKFRLNRHAIRLKTTTDTYELVANKHKKLLRFLVEIAKNNVTTDSITDTNI